MYRRPDTVAVRVLRDIADPRGVSYFTYTPRYTMRWERVTAVSDKGVLCQLGYGLAGWTAIRAAIRRIPFLRSLRPGGRISVRRQYRIGFRHFGFECIVQFYGERR